jgi:hypothetical protein
MKKQFGSVACFVLLFVALPILAVQRSRAVIPNLHQTIHVVNATKFCLVWTRADNYVNATILSVHADGSMWSIPYDPAMPGNVLPAQTIEMSELSYLDLIIDIGPVGPGMRIFPANASQYSKRMLPFNRASGILLKDIDTFKSGSTISNTLLDCPAFGMANNPVPRTIVATNHWSEFLSIESRFYSLGASINDVVVSGDLQVTTTIPEDPKDGFLVKLLDFYVEKGTGATYGALDQYIYDDKVLVNNDTHRVCMLQE